MSAADFTEVTIPPEDIEGELDLRVDQLGYLHLEVPPWFRRPIRDARVDTPYGTFTACFSKGGYATPLIGDGDRRLGDHYVWPFRLVHQVVNPELHPDLIRFADDHNGTEHVYRMRVIDRFGVYRGDGA